MYATCRQRLFVGKHSVGLISNSKCKLETTMRINQKQYEPQPHIFRKSRKRIETLFSELRDQFMIRRTEYLLKTIKMSKLCQIF